MAKQPGKLFKSVDDAERRTIRTVFRVNRQEHKQIETAAAARKMDVSEFMRRAALGRRADVDYVTDIVVELSDLTRAIRAFHAAMVERGLMPPEGELLPLILEARAAMLRISK